MYAPAGMRLRHTRVCTGSAPAGIIVRDESRDTRCPRAVATHRSTCSGARASSIPPSSRATGTRPAM
jgi:hypothetical protein